MSSKPNKLNGSVDLLADAMHKVFQESMEVVESSINSKLGAMEERMTSHFDGQIDTTNQNMSIQFAEVHKEVGKLVAANKQKTSAKKPVTSRARK